MTDDANTAPVAEASRRICAALLDGLDDDPATGWAGVGRAIKDIQMLARSAAPGDETALQPLALLLSTSVVLQKKKLGVSEAECLVRWPVTVQGLHVHDISLRQALELTALTFSDEEAGSATVSADEEPRRTRQDISGREALKMLVARGHAAGDTASLALGVKLMSSAEEARKQELRIPPAATQIAAMEALAALAKPEDKRVHALLVGVLELEVADVSAAAAQVLQDIGTKLSANPETRAKLLELVLPSLRSQSSARRTQAVALVRCVAPYGCNRVLEYGIEVIRSTFSQSKGSLSRPKAPAGGSGVRESAVEVMLAVSMRGHVNLVSCFLRLAADGQWPVRRFGIACLPRVVCAEGSQNWRGDEGMRGRSLSPPYTQPADESLDRRILASLRDSLEDLAAQVREIALRVLLKLGAPSSPGLSQAVTGCLEDDNWVVREAAAECIASLFASKSPQQESGGHLGQDGDERAKQHSVNREALQAVSASLFEDVSVFSHHVRQASEASIVPLAPPLRRRDVSEAVKRSRIQVHSVYVPEAPKDSLGRPRLASAEASDNGAAAAGNNNLGWRGRQGGKAVAEVRVRLEARALREERGDPGADDILRLACGEELYESGQGSSCAYGGQAQGTAAEQKMSRDSGCAAVSDAARRRQQEHLLVVDWIKSLGSGDDSVGGEGGRALSRPMKTPRVAPDGGGVTGVRVSRDALTELGGLEARGGLQQSGKSESVTARSSAGHGWRHAAGEVGGPTTTVAPSSPKPLSVPQAPGPFPGAKESSAARGRRIILDARRREERQLMSALNASRADRDAVVARLQELLDLQATYSAACSARPCSHTLRLQRDGAGTHRAGGTHAMPQVASPERGRSAWVGGGSRMHTQSRRPTAASADTPWRLVKALFVTVLSASCLPILEAEGWQRNLSCEAGWLAQEHVTDAVTVDADCLAPGWHSTGVFLYPGELLDGAGEGGEAMRFRLLSRDQFGSADVIGYASIDADTVLTIITCQNESLEGMALEGMAEKIDFEGHDVQTWASSGGGGDGGGGGGRTRRVYIGAGKEARVKPFASSASLPVLDGDGQQVRSLDGQPCSLHVRVSLAEPDGWTGEVQSMGGDLQEERLEILTPRDASLSDGDDGEGPGVRWGCEAEDKEQEDSVQQQVAAAVEHLLTQLVLQHAEMANECFDSSSLSIPAHGEGAEGASDEARGEGRAAEEEPEARGEGRAAEEEPEARGEGRAADEEPEARGEGRAAEEELEADSVGYDARQPRPRAVGWQHLEDLEAEEEEQEGAKAGGCRSGSVGSSRNAGAMREQGTSRNAMLRKLQMMTLEMERTQKEVSLLNAQVRDLEVRYDEAYLRRADGDETKAVSEVIVGLHIPAREGLKVMLRKQLVDVLFPDLWADSLGGPGNVVWVDDGSLAAATAAIRVPSGEAAAADPSDQEGWERQVRGRAGAVCEVIWEATGKQISYPTGLLGEYRLASYDANLAIKSRILSAGEHVM